MRIGMSFALTGESEYALSKVAGQNTMPNPPDLRPSSTAFIGVMVNTASLDRHVGRFCPDLGRVADVATRWPGPESVADDCGCVGDFCQCRDLDCARRARATVLADTARKRSECDSRLVSLDRAGRVQPHVEIIVDRSPSAYPFHFHRNGWRAGISSWWTVMCRCVRSLSTSFCTALGVHNLVACAMDDDAR